MCVIRVVVGAFMGICIGLIAPTVGARVTGIDFTSDCRSNDQNRGGSKFAVVAIFLVVFVLISVVIENWAVVLAGWVLSLGMITSSWIDARTHRLPRNLSYLTFGVGVPLLVIAAIIEDSRSHIVNSLIGVLVATSAIGFIYLIGRGAMGSGDVRLAPVIGLYVGWISVKSVVIALITSFMVAAIFALVVLLLGRANRSDEIPFGPFLAFGTLVIFVFSAAKSGL